MPESSLPLHIEALPDGGYLATSPAIPGLIAHGTTIAQAAAAARELSLKIIDSCRQHGDALPPALHNGPPQFSRLPGSADDAPNYKLAGFTRHDATRMLRQCGYILDRQTPAGAELWRHPVSGRKVTVPNHRGDLAAETLTAIFHAAGLDLDEISRD
jgi:predicted RNase H-like HicB family nuclease